MGSLLSFAVHALICLHKRNHLLNIDLTTDVDSSFTRCIGNIHTSAAAGAAARSCTTAQANQADMAHDLIIHGVLSGCCMKWGLCHVLLRTEIYSQDQRYAVHT